MPTTPVNGFPYPDDEYMPDGPVQIGALGLALDTFKWGSRNLKPTVGAKFASEAKSLGSSYADIALSGGNLALTPAVASTLLVVATFDFSIGAFKGTPQIAEGTIRLDSEDQTPTARLVITSTAALEGGSTNAPGISSTVTQTYALALTAAEHTIKMRAKRGANSASQTAEATNTRMLYLLVAS